MLKSVYVLFFVLFVAPLAFAEVFKCVGKTGEDLYQNFPCQFESMGGMPIDAQGPKKSPALPVEQRLGMGPKKSPALPAEPRMASHVGVILVGCVRDAQHHAVTGGQDLRAFYVAGVTVPSAPSRTALEQPLALGKS